MKLIKEAGKTQLKISRTEWEEMGKKNGWLKEASWMDKLVAPFSKSPQEGMYGAEIDDQGWKVLRSFGIKHEDLWRFYSNPTNNTDVAIANAIKKYNQDKDANALKQTLVEFLGRVGTY